MPPAERFSVVAPLPPHGGWRRALALDRSGTEPHAVVLAFVPQVVLDDPARLAGLVRDVEAAGRLHHPYAVPVLGTETIDDGLAIVEAHRPGTSLRALLDAGGRLPPDVAVRIAIDACAAVSRAHAIDAGDGRKLVHGAIAPSRILVAEDGAALVTGFGIGNAAEPPDDVRALAAVLHECLAGEPPGHPPASLEEAGVTASLSAAVAHGLGPAPDAPATPAAFVESVVAAGTVASHADVAAYVDAILPPGEGARGEIARALANAVGAHPEEVVSADDIVEPTEPSARRSVPTPEPLPRPPATRPGADPAGEFAAPPRRARRSRTPVVAVIACAALGFGGGYVASRSVKIPFLHGEPAAAAPEAPGPVGAITEGSATPTSPATPTSAARASSPSPQRGGGDGRGEGTKAPHPGAADALTTRPPGQGDGAKRVAPAKRAAKGARAATEAMPRRKGMLHVAAPADAEVFLDERPIGKGNVHVEVPEGAHRVEVRRGEARVAESFTLAPGETWTYDVTPTP